MTPDGIYFIGPNGEREDEATHIQRLMRNARMRFNRSVTGWGMSKASSVSQDVSQQFLDIFKKYVYKIGTCNPTIPQLPICLPGGPNCPKAIVDLYNSRTGSSWAAAVFCTRDLQLEDFKV